MRLVPQDRPRRTDPDQQDDLLIEAVSLLVQRQREIEAWAADRVYQSEERAAAMEQRHTDVEVRLTAIEDQLARLAREVAPGRAKVADDRVSRLREQIEDLRTAGDGFSARALAPEIVAAQPHPDSPSGAPTSTATTTRGSVSFWDLFGQTPVERFGFLLIGVGGVAVLYALLSFLRVG
jgi:hypothetical protein